MRARHRCSAQKHQAAAGLRRGQDVRAWRSDVRLQNAAGKPERPARAEGVDDVAIDRVEHRADARDRAVVLAALRDPGLDRDTGAVADMHRRQIVIVADDRLAVARRIREDIAARARSLEIEAFFDASVSTAIADHDFAVERASGPGTARAGRRRLGRTLTAQREAEIAGVDDLRRTVAAGESGTGDIRRRIRDTVEIDQAVGEAPVVARARDADHPGRVARLGHRMRRRAFVAGRYRDHDACGTCAEHRSAVVIVRAQFGIGIERGAADRKIDHIDLICHRLIDRGQKARSGAGAAGTRSALVDPAGLVHDQVCVRRDARHCTRQIDGLTVQRGAVHVPRHDAADMGAVAGAVDTLGALIGEIVDADQLVGAARLPCRTQAVLLAARIGVHIAVAAGRGERGVSRIDAAVDHADDDALALRRSHAVNLAVPQFVGADPLRTRVGMRARNAFALHRCDAGHLRHAIGFCLCQNQRHAVDRVTIDLCRSELTAEATASEVERGIARAIELAQISRAFRRLQRLTHCLHFPAPAHSCDRLRAYALQGIVDERCIAQGDDIRCLGIHVRCARGRHQHCCAQRDRCNTKGQPRCHNDLQYVWRKCRLVPAGRQRRASYLAEVQARSAVRIVSCRVATRLRQRHANALACAPNARCAAGICVERHHHRL